MNIELLIAQYDLALQDGRNKDAANIKELYLRAVEKLRGELYEVKP
jgi:hypothetical protein